MTHGSLRQNITKIHTTPLGAERIRHHLHLGEDADPAAWCIRQIQNASDGDITQKGKNWYVRTSSGCVITVNAKSFTLITARRESLPVRTGAENGPRISPSTIAEGQTEMTIQVYCYDRCTTCQKALKWLDSQGVQYNKIDIKGSHPDAETLRALWQKSGLPLRRFFNTSGMIYREMGLSQKLADMSEDEMIALLAADGMLVKRPLLVTEEAALPGFREADWKKALGV